MRFLHKSLLVFVFIGSAAGSFFAQTAPPTGSGGPLSAEQAAYDVEKYDIKLRVYPESKSIDGVTIITAKIISPTNVFVVDLDTPLEVRQTLLGESGKPAKEVKFERRGGQILIRFPLTKQPGERVNVAIWYLGKPRIAPNPPWVGGFMWEKTAGGADWIATACQNDGADLWYPVKDHPSDEPDSVALHITVPEELYAASNGKLQGINQNDDRTKTYHWLMSSPVNNYNVALNIAPYKPVERTYKSIAGETFPIIFYALPESVEKAPEIVAQTVLFLDFYEKYLGPYPYRTEKLGIAETPHLGMEHSTIIAYGNKFRRGDDGFDWLMLHELGHEWWGNLVTASDWRDMWIHEGFQSFMDTLYVEETKGREAYLQAMQNRVRGFKNKQAVAPRESRQTYQIYFLAPDYKISDGDIYGKGAVILHTLRYLIGDEAFFRGLRRMAYPSKEMESLTDGRQNRFATTDDVKEIFEEESKMDLDWFFEVYLRQPVLPKLKFEQVEGTGGRSVNFSWETPDNLPFPMPVEVRVGEEIKRVKVTDNFGRMPIQPGQELVVDPNGWILKSE